MFDKYVKVVYESEPIGAEQIVLYLTTFDIEALKRDEELERRQAFGIYVEKEGLKNDDFIKHLEKMLEDRVDECYKKYMDELHGVIKSQNMVISDLLQQNEWLEKTLERK